MAALSLLLSLLWLFITCTIADNSFENTAVVRTIELAGSLVHVRTTFAAKALDTGAMIYAFALGSKEAENSSFLEARIKGEQTPLDLQHLGFNSQSGLYLYAAMLPNGLKKGDSINIELESVQTHATYPLPEAIGQSEDMYLVYETDLFILSPYETKVQRTKIRAPSPQVKTYSQPTGLDAFTLDAPSTKQASTITYGPFNNIPPSANADFVSGSQQRVKVQYKHDQPVMQITKLERAAEISHWGANINLQDNIWLHNAGAQLKGHFSRLEHQRQAYSKWAAGHVMRAMNIYLPPGVHDVYYTDTVGNVSTSHLRESTSVAKGARSKQNTFLELRPRYPLLGGWNYSFTLGFDAPLNDWTAYDKRDGRYVVSVPILTQFPDTVVNEAELKVILPEGATDIEVYPSFAPLTVKKSIHYTYLDTKGRPALTLYYKNLTDRHAGFVYIGYKVPFTAHLRKPVTIAAIFFGLFVFSLGARRVDMKIRDRKS